MKKEIDGLEFKKSLFGLIGFICAFGCVFSGLYFILSLFIGVQPISNLITGFIIAVGSGLTSAFFCNKALRIGKKVNSLKFDPDHAEVRSFFTRHPKVSKLKLEKDDNYGLVFMNKNNWLMYEIADGHIYISVPAWLKPHLNLSNTKWRERITIKDLPRQVY